MANIDRLFNNRGWFFRKFQGILSEFMNLYSLENRQFMGLIGAMEQQPGLS